MLANLNGWHLIIVLAVILLLFGAAKLPGLAKSMGQSARIFKGEMKAMKAIEEQPDPTQPLATEIEASVAEHTAPVTAPPR